MRAVWTILGCAMLALAMGGCGGDDADDTSSSGSQSSGPTGSTSVANEVDAAIQTPELSGDPLTAARETSAMGLKLLAMNMLIYASDHDGAFPSEQGATGFKQMLDEGYLGEFRQETFRRRDDARAPAGDAVVFSDEHTSFLYLGAEWFPSLANRMRLPLVMEKPGLDSEQLTAATGRGETITIPGEFRTVTDFAEAFIAKEQLETEAPEAARQLRLVAQELDATRDAYHF